MLPVPMLLLKLLLLIGEGSQQVLKAGLYRASEDPGFAHTVCAGLPGVAGLLGQFVWVTLVMY